MQLAISRTVTAGVVLVGASAIALTPIAGTLPGVPLPSMRSADVQIAAFVNPIEEWVQVIGTSFDNLSSLGTQFQNDPLPILSQLLDNQLANAKTVFDAGANTLGQAVTTFASLPQAFFNAGSQIAQGHLADAVQTLWGGILPLVIIPIIPITAVAPVVQTAVQNVANVIGALGGVNLLITGIAVISPLYATITQFGNTAQAIFDAAGKGDFATVASEILNAPAALTNAFLNGDDSTPGLLTPTSGVGGGGTIAALLNLRDTVADALKPAAVPTPAAARSTAATKRAATVKTSGRSAAATAAPKASGAGSTAGGNAKTDGTGGSAKSEKPGGKPGSARHRGAA